MKYTRFSTLLIAAFLLMLFFVPGTVQAKAVTPHTTCGPCLANNQWQNALQGMKSTFLVQDPTANLNGNSWARYLQVGHNGQLHVSVGIEAFDFSNGCGTSSPGLFFWYEWQSASNSGSDCTAVSSSYVGTDQWFKIGPYSSGGGGMFVQTSTNYCTTGCFFPGLGTTYHYEYMAETISSNNFTGTAVPINDWTSNQYQDTNGLHYWTSDGTSGANDPPQLYWASGNDPAHSSTGGDLVTCDKASSVNQC